MLVALAVRSGLDLDKFHSFCYCYVHTHSLSLTLNVPCTSESCIETKINLIFSLCPGLGREWLIAEDRMFSG